MNGSRILLQIAAPLHALTSHAKLFGTWINMLPFCLRIGRFNVRSRGIVWVLDASAVHHIRGHQHLMRVPGTGILDPEIE